MSAPMVHRIELPDGTVAGATRIDACGFVVIARAMHGYDRWTAVAWCETRAEAEAIAGRYPKAPTSQIYASAEIVELTQCDGCGEMTPADTSSGELAGAVLCERCRDRDHAEMMRRDVAPIAERREAAEADEVAREFEADVLLERDK